MPTIELSETTFDRLKELAEPLVDTPETVISRLVDGYLSAERGNGAKPKDGKRGRKRWKRAHRDRKRARKGERTPTEGFYAPLLQVLKEAGGQLTANEAIDLVGELTEDHLNEVDRARLPSGEIRWRNTVRWAKQRLGKQGKLDSKSPYGFLAACTLKQQQIGTREID